MLDVYHSAKYCLQPKFEVIVNKKKSQDASGARYGAVFVGLYCIWLGQSLSGGVMGRVPYLREIYYYI